MPANEASSSTEPESEGVLLYYKYVKISDVSLIVNWYEDICLQLRLIGRIRVSPEGVNVTVGGLSSALEEHIHLVSNHPSLGSCDFKVARCKEPLLANPVLIQECGFDSLSVRAVKEVVSLGHGATHVSSAEAGVHLSPAEFHQHLLAAASEQENALSREGDRQERGIVVLDARNMYETRIGHFQQLPGIEFCDPGIRQFSELPAWFDANEDRLRDKHVYMYCTGGVRCERASAYLRVKGPGFRNVYQLSGGIQRYLEAFPDGGLFEGKNFVFDPRCAVGSLDERKVGRCLRCHSPYDDYAPRCRCSLCRVLVLVCNPCREMGDSQKFVCELCLKSRVGPGREDVDDRAGLREEGVDGGLGDVKREVSGEDEGFVPGRVSKGDGTEGSIGRTTRPGSGDMDQERETRADSVIQIGSAAPVKARGEELGLDSERPSESPQPRGEALSAPRRRLRVLCLHGFRQTGQGLKGRLAAFQRSVKDLVEMVFVDAPHQLPCVFYPKDWTGGAEKEERGLGRGKKGGGRGSDAREVEERGVVGGDNRGMEGDGECAAPETDGIEGGQLGEEGGSRERQPCNGKCRGGEEVGCAKNAGNAANGTMVTSVGNEVQELTSVGPLPKFAWLVSLEQLQEIADVGSRAGAEAGATAEGPCAEGSSRGTVSAAERKLLGLEKGVGSGAETEMQIGTAREGPGAKGSTTGTVLERERSGSKEEKEAPGRSDLIRSDGAKWRPAAAPFGPLQYLTQTAGWSTSLAHLRRVFSEQGPFDGVLGFSQGAAVAAALCRYRGGGEGPPIAFKFAVLCSGFRSPAEGAADGSPGVIDIPSLHIYGAQKGRDRQIKVAESEKLAEQFEPSRRVVVEHCAGHIVPISKSYCGYGIPALVADAKLCFTVNDDGALGCVLHATGNEEVLDRSWTQIRSVIG